MNNKGYTLIELMAAIILLAVIITIAVPSINSVSKAIRNAQRNNLIKEIETSASIYAYKTGETLIFVDDLIKEGYIASDDEEGNIIDPSNSNRLNCYLVEMEKSGDYYRAKFLDDYNYDLNGICDVAKMESDNSKILIGLIVNGVEADSSNWISGKKSINLATRGNGVTYDCNIDECVWTSSSGISIEGKSSITINNISGLLNTKYTFQLTKKSADQKISRYTASINIKIDNENPTIYNNDFAISNRYTTSKEKEVTIEASDGKGSGLAGYALIYEGASCNSVTYQASNKFTVTKNGRYLVCVKDNVGNVSSYNNLIIDYIG